MNGLTKGVFVLMILLISVTYMMYKSDVVLVDTKKEAYTSIIKAASQVATREILDTMDANATYDGVNTEAMDLPINMNALKTFNRTVERLLSTQASSKLKDVTRMNVVMIGFVTYDYIVGVVNEGGGMTTPGEIGKDSEHDIDSVFMGSYLLPIDYSVYIESSELENADNSCLNSAVWKFTLGNKVMVKDVEYTISDTDGKSLIDSSGTEIGISEFLDSVGFKTGQSLSQFVVMSRIDEYLNNYCGTTFNKTAENVGSGLVLNLGKANYSDGKKVYTTKSSVISGPGMFAVVDVFTGSNGKETLYERVASFGGSEIKQVLD